MKLKIFATATTTLLGAALVGYGQTQNEQRPDSVLGASNTEQTSGAAGTSATADQGGATPGQGGAPRSGVGGVGTDAGTGTTGAGRSPQQQQQPGQTAQQQQQRPTEQAQQGLDRSEAERAQRAQTMRDMDWNDADETGMKLNEIPERARNTLTTVTTGAQLDEQVSKLTKNNYEVFKAKVTRANEQDLHIFVAQDGTVVKTMQQVELTDAPQSVRNAIREEVGDEPQQLHRVIADDETSYVTKAGEAEDAPEIRVDNTGNVIKSRPGEENRKEDSPAGQQGQPQGQQQQEGDN